MVLPCMWPRFEQKVLGGGGKAPKLIGVTPELKGIAVLPLLRYIAQPISAPMTAEEYGEMKENFSADQGSNAEEENSDSDDAEGDGISSEDED
ncbi:hypothetical protein ACHAQA_006733 [Verticillium albo-atrum]